MDRDVQNLEIDKKIQELMEKRAFTDVSFMKNAFLTLKMGRESLKYSYIFLAFIPAETNTDMFSHLQGTLQMCIKNQLTYLSTSADSCNPTLIKKQTIAINTTLQNMLQHIESIDDVIIPKGKKEDKKEDKKEETLPK